MKIYSQFWEEMAETTLGLITFLSEQTSLQDRHCHSLIANELQTSHGFKTIFFCFGCDCYLAHCLIKQQGFILTLEF